MRKIFFLFLYLVHTTTAMHNTILISHLKNIYNQDPQAGNQRLKKLIETSNYETLKKLFEIGINPNSCDEHNNTLLHYASEKNDLITTGFLLSFNALINAENHCGDTPLHIALKENSKACASLLIQNKNIDVNKSNTNKITPLHYAVMNRMLNVTEELLKRNAQIDAQDAAGNTPLHNAVIQNKCENFALLIKYKANVNIKNKDGKTPLHFAQYQDPEYAQLLIKNGATKI
jgi:ankyrin repeat protein